MGALQILTIIIVLLSIFYAANNPKKTKEALDYLGGFGVTVIGFLFIVIFGIPYLVDYAEPTIERNYSDMLNDARNVQIDFDFFRPNQSQEDWVIPTQPAAPQAVPGQPQFPTAVPQQPTVVARVEGTQHTVKAGETLREIAEQYGVSVEDLVSLNGLSDPNVISVGQVLLISPQSAAVPEAQPEAVATPAPALPTPAPTAVPTPEPVSYDAYYRALAELRQMGAAACPPAYQVLAERLPADSQVASMTARECGRMIANYLFSLDPGAPVANTARDEISVAQAKLEAMGNLGLRTQSNWLGLAGFDYAAGAADQIDGLLSGLELQIVEVSPAWNGSAWNSPVTVQVISKGWLFGERFVMAAGHATRHNAKNVNDTFVVR